MNMSSWFIKFFGVSSFVLIFQWSTTNANVLEYLRKPQPKASWKVIESSDSDHITTYRLELVSQTWQKIDWKHSVMVYYPKELKHQKGMFLWITGGNPSLATHMLATSIVKQIKAPIAFLYDIPNQPLLGGKNEDSLIAETFVRYLDTGDPSWPLLFPMVRSVVYTMDVLQQFSKEKWGEEIQEFVLSGASKRGWTTWLSAASEDKRILGIAPLVIDTLNMRKQLPHQIQSYGKPSAQIKDYVKRKLVPIDSSSRAQELWEMVDPWTYRHKIKQPKLIINGTNDPYWTQDSLNLYWDDLSGDKWILYVPNAGHGLEQKYDDHHKDRQRVLNTLCVYCRHLITKKPMPKIHWQHKEQQTQDGKEFCVELQCEPKPKRVRLWSADSSTRDFRDSKWNESPATIENGVAIGKVKTPENGFRVFLLEGEYEFEGIPYFLSSQLRIIDSKKN